MTTDRLQPLEAQRLPQKHVDKLADILWWIQGRVDSDTYEPFNHSHIEALREARIVGMEDVPEVRVMQDVLDNVGAPDPWALLRNAVAVMRDLRTCYVDDCTLNGLTPRADDVIGRIEEAWAAR